MSSTAPEAGPSSAAPPPATPPHPSRAAAVGHAPAPKPVGPLLAAAFASFYLALGIQMPYLPLWLQHRGLGPEEIGVAVAVPLLTRLVSTPILGFLSDKVGRPRATLSALAAMTCVSMGLLALSFDPLVIFLVLGLTALSWHPSFALLDSYASRQAMAGRADYGRSRQWGSGAFLVANLFGGVVITATGAGSVVLWMVLGMASYLAVTFALPELPAPKRPERRAQGFDRSQLWLVAAVIAVALVQASHALLYAFASVHWRALGWSLTTIGFLWATGVAAEIVLFRFGTRLMARFGPHRLIVLGGVMAVVRFGAMAFEPPLGMLFALQLLHGFTFGATYLGMVELVARSVSEHRSGSAQSLAAWTVNVVMSAATVASGALWVELGAGAFAISAALGGAGALLAVLVRRRTH